MQYVTNEREKKVLSTVKDNTFFLRYMYTPKKKKKFLNKPTNCKPMLMFGKIMPAGKTMLSNPVLLRVYLY